MRRCKLDSLGEWGKRKGVQRCGKLLVGQIRRPHGRRNRARRSYLLTSARDAPGLVSSAGTDRSARVAQSSPTLSSVFRQRQGCAQKKGLEQGMVRY